MNHALYLFRRDFRLFDNTALNAAVAQYELVTTGYIKDEFLLDRWSMATARLRFLDECIDGVSRELEAIGGELQIREGAFIDILRAWIRESEVNAVFLNREYTPFGRRREKQIVELSREVGARCHIFDDAVLHPPERILKADGQPYSVFTPYYNRASGVPVEPSQDFVGAELPEFEPGDQAADVEVLEHASTGGRNAALRCLQHTKTLRDYGELRDIPGEVQTSRISAHLRFGTISVRECYEFVNAELGPGHPLVRQLHWRDFYTQIAWHYPHVFRGAFRRHYNAIDWHEDVDLFKKWCHGETGFPIVDAGMRELNETGYMHNRVRMVVASFLTKNLQISWQRGERHFAENLIDYDPMSNNGNWQWAASTGCDAQPYFRVFNPWRQQRRFDQDCVYIKRWIPELRDRSSAEIHKLEQHPDSYLPQIVDLRESSQAIKAKFKAISSKLE